MRCVRNVAEHLTDDGTFVVEALIDNPAGELKPGSYAKASIRTDKVDRIHMVPVRAISYVFGANKEWGYKVSGEYFSAEKVVGSLMTRAGL